MHPELPQEIIDKILLKSDVRLAICFDNEYVKQQLLPHFRIPWSFKRRNEGKFKEWIKRYRVGSALEHPDFGRRITCTVGRSFCQHYPTINLPPLQVQSVAWTRHIGAARQDV